MENIIVSEKLYKVLQTMTGQYVGKFLYCEDTILDISLTDDIKDAVELDDRFMQDYEKIKDDIGGKILIVHEKVSYWEE